MTKSQIFFFCKKSNNIVLINLIITIFGISQVYAQMPTMPGMALISTENGCQAYIDESMGRSPVPSVKLSFQWEGNCVGGLAQGRGILKMKMQGGSFPYETQMHHIYNAGIAVGYGKWISISSSNPSKEDVNYVFSYGNKFVSFRNMGLQIEEAAFTSSTISLPKDDRVHMANKGSILTLTSSYVQTISLCALEIGKVPKITDCNEGESTEIPVMWRFPRGGDALSNFEKKQEFYCPNPKVFDSACSDHFYMQTASARKEIIDFITTSKSSVETILQRLEAGRQK